MPDASQKKLISNRIIGHGNEPVDAILFNPANWRIHPKVQQDALQGVLEEVGWVQDVVINKTTGHLIDGHLRCQLAGRNGEKTVPAVYVELSQEEENIILASFDTITVMAKTDHEKLLDLVNRSSDTEQGQRLAEVFGSIRNEFDLSALANNDTDGQLIDRFNITVSAPKTEVNENSVFRLSRHVLICCSPVFAVGRWLKYLSPLDIFVPYPSPSTFLVEIDAGSKIVGVNPSQYICGHIVDRFKEIHGENNVRQEN